MSKLPAVSDEVLMAYADGELGDGEADRIGRAIDNDPALAARLKVFRLTGRTLAPQFDALDLGETPASMLDAIRSTPVRTRPTLASRLQGFLDGLRLGPTPWPALAGLAAGLLIGVSVAQLAGHGGTMFTVKPDGMIVASGTLGKILESSPSAVAGTSDIVATSSFESVDDRYCRLYQAPRQTGLACRNPAGDWQILAMGEGTPGAGETEYGPSGGSGASAVSDLVGQMRKSEAALSPATEADLIARKWEAR